MDVVTLLVTLAMGAAAGWLWQGLWLREQGFGLLWNVLIGIRGAF